MSIPVIQENWFEDWFDSPFYPMLYAHRSEQEAAELINNIVHLLNIPVGSRILDLACGRGRHAIALAAKGFDVTGVDLSEESIADAKLHESENLHFNVHDMRRPVAINYFDATLNLFTSFGYFTTVRDNVRTIDSIHAALKMNGTLILDYFNSGKVRALVAACSQGEKQVGDVSFKWKKTIENDAVVKRITVNFNGEIHHYAERVQLFSLEQLKELLSDKFEVTAVFGDYSLADFDEVNSDRMILRCNKK